MNDQKDEPRAIEFMRLFHELRSRTGDAAHLRERTTTDSDLRELCYKLQFSALIISSDERKHRSLFRQPVDNSFIESWRNYQAHWESVILDIAWTDICDGIVDASFASEVNDPFTSAWSWADGDAKKVVEGFDLAMDRAFESVEFGDFPESYPESVSDAVHEYRLLPKRTGFDLRGILRRRALVPVVLVPRHVANGHEVKNGPYPDKKLSLWLPLQQAQEAFIFGLPLAAVSQMRALTELVLTCHYGFDKDNLSAKLGCLESSDKELLVNLRQLANDALHNKLRNDVRGERFDDLHRYAASLADEKNQLSREAIIRVERDLVAYLTGLRRLIEKAPLAIPMEKTP